MLTVKLVEPSGHEQVHEVSKVWAEHNPDFEGVSLPFPVFVVLTAVHNSDAVLTFSGCGTIYVMNDNGATVAKYFLGYGNEKDMYLKNNKSE